MRPARDCRTSQGVAFLAADAVSTSRRGRDGRGRRGLRQRTQAAPPLDEALPARARPEPGDHVDHLAHVLRKRRRRRRWPSAPRELAAASGTPDTTAGIATIFGSGIRALALKRGARGSTIFRPDRAPADVMPFPIEVLNVLGAGDAFASGFLYGFLQGWPLERAARMRPDRLQQPQVVLVREGLGGIEEEGRLHPEAAAHRVQLCGCRRRPPLVEGRHGNHDDLSNGTPRRRRPGASNPWPSRCFARPYRPRRTAAAFHERPPGSTAGG
jgi:hypothetical protein